MYGALSLSGSNVGFDAQGTAMVPVSAGKNKLGTIELKSPLDTFKDTFFDMKESLSAMVGIQTEEAKRQEFVDRQLLEQKSFENEQANKKFEDDDMQGPALPTLDNFKGVDTDKEPEQKESVIGSILKTLKDSFQQVEFGDKMTALLMMGGLAIFLKYKDQIVAALTPLVSFFKGVVDILGVEGTLMLLFGSILLIKLAPVITAAFAIVQFLGGFLPSFKTLKLAFASMRLFLGTTLPAQLTSIRASGAFAKATKMLGFAFKALRLMMTVSLYPAIMSMVATLSTALGPILGPLVVIAAIAAGITAVLFSIKSGFETFKNSLAEGDSMLLAIGKGIADFALTLYTLPLTLIKKLVGYIAGLLGFDGIKAALDKFSFKDLIKNSFMSLVTGFVRIIKAIAKGVGAALSAIAPGGKTPQGEFGRVFNEVMQGGKGSIKIEKAEGDKVNTDGEPEFTEEQIKTAETLQAPVKFVESVIGKFKGDRFIEGTPAYERKKIFEASQAEKKLSNKERSMNLDDYNKSILRKMDPGAMYNEISDKSTKVINKTEVNEAPLAADNTETTQRLINAMA